MDNKPRRSNRPYRRTSGESRRSINMTFISVSCSEINSAALSEAARTNLEKVAGVFVKISETNILIEGHTDDTGTPSINMELSTKRAYSVSEYLQSKE